MANRNFTQFQFSLVKGVVQLWARVTVAGGGAVTLTKWNPASRSYTAAPTTGTGPYAIGCEGIKSITRNSAGVYSFVLQDTYQRLLNVCCTASNATGLPTTPMIGLWSTATDVTSATAPTIKLTMLSASATAADPASGDVLNFIFVLQNASVI